MKAVRDVLHLYGIPHCRMNSGAVTGSYKGKARFVRFHDWDGMSDIVGILPTTGQLIGIECKLPGNRPTAKQKAWIDMIRDANGIAFTAWDLEDVMDELIKPYILNADQ